MPNQAFVIPTKFENIRNGEIQYGFRTFDDYAEGITWLPYDMEKIPDDDLECLRIVLDSDDTATIGVMDNILMWQSPVTIGNVLYSWEEIKGLFGMEDD